MYYSVALKKTDFSVSYENSPGVGCPKNWKGLRLPRTNIISRILPRPRTCAAWWKSAIFSSSLFKQQVYLFTPERLQCYITKNLNLKVALSSSIPEASTLAGWSCLPRWTVAGICSAVFRHTAQIPSCTLRSSWKGILFCNNGRYQCLSSVLCLTVRYPL